MAPALQCIKAIFRPWVRRVYVASTLGLLAAGLSALNVARAEAEDPVQPSTEYVQGSSRLQRGHIDASDHRDEAAKPDAPITATQTASNPEHRMDRAALQTYGSTLSTKATDGSGETSACSDCQSAKPERKVLNGSATQEDILQQQQLQQQAAMSDTDKHQHKSGKGLMGHIAGAVGKVGETGLNIGMATVTTPSGFPSASVHPGAIPPGLHLNVLPGTCPAAGDPSFQIPSPWWRPYEAEMGSQQFASQWNTWFSTVNAAFKEHEDELAQARGVASIHVIVWPDGVIHVVTPYEGSERPYRGLATSQPLMATLYHICGELPHLPPFPQGTTVQQFHLVVNASSDSLTANK